jgi:prepilin-type N-terminal cleavage/methylation domain-containing protein
MSNLQSLRSQAGFTLVELLTVIAIIGVLSGLGLASFKVYRGDAAYSVAESSLRNARNAVEASVTNPDATIPSVALFSQNTAGSIQDPSAQVYLPGFQLPKNLRMSVQYDSTCTNAACIAEVLEFSHCFAHEYTRWVRFGNGSDFLLEHVAGGGC